MADRAPPPLHPAYTVTNIQQRIRVLDGEKISYPSWVNLFRLHATCFDVLHHIDGTPAPETTAAGYTAWKKLDAVVLQWIYATLSDDLLVRVLVSESTAYEAWNRVQNLFLNNKGSRAAALQHELTNLTLAAMPSLEAYCQRIRELADQSTAVDCPINNTQRVLYLVRGLPREYDAVGSLLNQTLPPWENACDQLQSEARRIAARDFASNTQQQKIMSDSYFSGSYADVDAKPVRHRVRPNYLGSTTHTTCRTGVRSSVHNETLSRNFNQLKINENEDENGENNTTGINFDAYEDIPVDITGSDVPDPVKAFAEIDLGSVLNENIKSKCKYVKPTPIQRYAIPVLVAGRDLMACAQTGSGKTAAFCFPIISRIWKMRLPVMYGGGGRITTVYPLALILSPTRELCCQIFEEAKKFCDQTGVKVAVAYGGAPIYPQLKSFENGVDILVATPGRLTDMIERSKVSLKKIKYLALDEADRMLDMGFEPQIRKIVERFDMPQPGKRQTMLFSATFPSEIRRLALDFLSNYIFLSVGRVGSSTDLILQKVVFVEDLEKQEYLRNLLHDQKANGNLGKNALTLIFVETKKSADQLKHWLCRTGFPATTIHGDKVQFERERALKLFKNGVTPILVATDVASRGLDIPCVAHVINFDLPRDIDSYVHRIGRTGRAGKSGLATAVFNGKNSIIAKALSEIIKEANQEAPDWLGQYAESYSSSAGNIRHVSNKFGGHDFRSGNDNSYGTSGGFGNDTSFGHSNYGGTGCYRDDNSYGNSGYGGSSGAFGNSYGNSSGSGNNNFYGNSDYGGTSGGSGNYAPPPAAAAFSDGGGDADGWE